MTYKKAKIFFKKRLYYSINILNLPSQYGKRVVVLLNKNAKIAQLVERDLAKVEVAGSSPVFRSKAYNYLKI